MGLRGPMERRRERARMFWRRVAAGASVPVAAEAAGVSLRAAGDWFRDAGGMNPLHRRREPSGRYLSWQERDEIARHLARGETPAQIARRLGRDRSTICREVARNGGPGGYGAGAAQRRADAGLARPKTSKIAGCPQLHDLVQQKLELKWSPEQISVWLRRQHPDNQQMQVSHESIYRSLYVQGRGELRRELAKCLRTGRAIRKPRRRGSAAADRGKIADMVMISQRPAEVEDRAVPGHWEGDLILGKHNRSAIGTLVERTTRFNLLLHLPDGHDAVSVRDAMVTAIGALPAQLRRSLTWDQGKEMARHAEISSQLGMQVYFCDPHSPWLRGTNENFNGLSRQYFPKGTDLSVHTAEDLARVSAEINERPRKTLGWRTPAEALAELLSNPEVATIT